MVGWSADDRDAAQTLLRPFRSTSFTAVVVGQVVAFLIGFVSQTYPDQAYVHVDGVPVAVGDDGEGEDSVIFPKNLDTLDLGR